ncbi:MAG: hypothetical protein AB7H96_02780 [Vicinamibacterales bacterium]
MTKYLAGVLTTIAVGVLLVAYGLLRGSQPMSASMRPVASDQPGFAQTVSLQQPAPGMMPYGMAVQPQVATAYVPQPAQVVSYVPAPLPPAYSQPVVVTNQPRPIQTVAYEPARRVRTSSTRVVEREPRRDWKRTAMVIGGSSAAGAGIGGIVGGKKGALIGAAIGGGASTLYETMKRD